MQGNVPSPQQGVATPVELDRFHEIEIEKVFDAMVSTFKLRVQLGTFFGTVNLAALSLAITTQKSIIFIFAGLLVVVFMILDFVGVAAILRLQYRGLQLTDKYAPQDTDNFFTLMLSRYEQRMKNIIALTEREKRLREVYTLPYKTLSFYGFWFPFIVSVVEILAGLFFCYYFKWPLF